MMSHCNAIPRDADYNQKVCRLNRKQETQKANRAELCAKLDLRMFQVDNVASVSTGPGQFFWKWNVEKIKNQSPSGDYRSPPMMWVIFKLAPAHEEELNSTITIMTTRQENMLMVIFYFQVMDFIQTKSKLRKYY